MAPVDPDADALGHQVRVPDEVHRGNRDTCATVRRRDRRAPSSPRGPRCRVDVKYFGRQSWPRSEVRQPFGSSRMIEKRPTGVTALPVAMRPPATRSRNGTFDAGRRVEHGDGACPPRTTKMICRALVDLDDVTARRAGDGRRGDVQRVDGCLIGDAGAGQPAVLLERHDGLAHQRARAPVDRAHPVAELREAILDRTHVVALIAGQRGDQSVARRDPVARARRVQRRCRRHAGPRASGATGRFAASPNVYTPPARLASQ